MLLGGTAGRVKRQQFCPSQEPIRSILQTGSATSIGYLDPAIFTPAFASPPMWCGKT
jgi:hypothetical protein